MGTSPQRARLAALRARTADLATRDQRRLRRRLHDARKLREPGTLDTVLDRIEEDLGEAEQRVQARRSRLPVVSYPAELPVSQRKNELLAAIKDHQVVIVAGETGSGKTTQLPKICLELGRGVQGMIGHTQPRRLAARSVADRIAEELGTELGDLVGYQVRFRQHTSEHTLVKVMTDGILLAELSQDRHLEKYDTLIIDEAHERSLNIDFILGYLRQLLPRRPDLKVVITSATIEPHRFARHFTTPADSGVAQPAPVVEVSGRVYPVELRYRPIEPPDSGGDARDLVQAITEAVDELTAEGPGDILVFLSGEREIRDAVDILVGQARPNTEILPLFARLSTVEQHRVFAPHPGRRIVLATNVAETSLTVPGIRYVIDPGSARISRYSNRLKVQRLPIEPISQASANQRAGRCGRLEDGVCIRLYDEEDYAARPPFTDPEILRTNLASVILQMAALNIGEIEDFPFIDPPDRRHIRDGVELLRELGALASPARGGNAQVKLTRVGRRLAGLPVDPRLGRMVLAAEDEGCVREVLVIAAALAIQDPRERPVEMQQAADRMHARFADSASDFLAYLNLWRYLRDQQKALSSSQFRRLCRTEYLHYLRVREWQDLESQLRHAARAIGVAPGRFPVEPDPDRIHRAVLAGLLSHIGTYDAEKRDYLGPRNARFAINPGSGLFRRSPRFVMAAELVETTRLWARIVARIEPEWIEPLAAHLVKRTYSEPHWERKQGAVIAHEKVSLFGVPIVTQRKVNYGRIDPELSRELFIRHALIEGDWDTRHEFFHDNQALLAEVQQLEERARRRDIRVEDAALFDFYDQRVGAEVVSTRHFDSWWEKVRKTQPDLLTFEKHMLVDESAAEVSEEDYPEIWRPAGGAQERAESGSIAPPLRLTYQFDPGQDADGVTVHIPLPALNQVRGERFDWQVPGLREELVIALIRSLPKSLRRSVVPIPEHGRAALSGIGPADGPLLAVLADRLTGMTGLPVPPDAWDLTRVPAHLKMTYRIEDGAGHTLAAGKDLERLAEQVRPATRAVLTAVAGGIEQRGLRAWDVGVLPKVIQNRRDGYEVKAYPALVDQDDSVAVQLFETPEEQTAAMWSGVRRLLLLSVPPPIAYLSSRLSNPAKLVLAHNPHGSVAALLDDCSAAAVDVVIAEAGGPPWDENGFRPLREQVRAELNQTVLAVVGRVQPILSALPQIEQRLPASPPPALADSVADIRTQLSGLVYPGFVTATGYRRLPDTARYLRAVAHRLDKLPANPARDRELTARVHQVEQRYQAVLGGLPPVARGQEDVARVRWMLEELRISYFAQAQGTAYPISDKRIRQALDRVEATYVRRA